MLAEIINAERKFMNLNSEIKLRVSVEKKNYARPQLAAFGSVKNLTQAGTGLSFENGMPGNCSQNKNDKPCSERRVKENIVRIGEHALGFGLYLFDYRAEYRDQWGHGRQFGVMIDEVEAIAPEAISQHADGFRRVDYSMLGIDRSIH